MRDPSEPKPPGATGASPDASRPDAPMQPVDPGAERGNASEQAAADSSVLVKRALAGAALTGLTELALGRRLYFAWEALRRAVKWLNESKVPRDSATEQQPTAPRSPGLPSAQEVIEEVVEEVMDRGQRAARRHKPMIERAGKRARERLKEPGIGAALIGGAALGVVASVGFLPAAFGAGTAYLVHRKLSSSNLATPVRSGAAHTT